MRAQVRIDFQGSGNVEAFSRACVQAMRDGVQLALRVARQVGTLGQVSAQQSIGQRFTQQSRHMPECLREARTGTPCIRPVHPSQEHQACDARSHRRHVRDLAASIGPSRPRPARLFQIRQRQRRRLGEHRRDRAILLHHLFTALQGRAGPLEDLIVLRPERPDALSSLAEPAKDWVRRHSRP